LEDHDGTLSVAAYIPLGLITSDQLDGLHDLAVAAGVKELRTTQHQNLVFLGVTADKVDALKAGLHTLGFEVPAKGDVVPHVVSCPGTTTCRIGITSSQGLARVVEAHGKNDPLAAQFSVHISGCPNSCGLHHVADIGLHGMSKKKGAGKVAPYYQLHFGGDARTGQVGTNGPLVPARQADEAIALLRQALVTGRKAGETVRDWATRLGKPGVEAILAPLEAKAEDGMFVDWGEDHEYTGPNTEAKSECAATFASEDLLADLTDDALISADRHIAVGREAEAVEWAKTASGLSARLLLLKRGLPTTDEVGSDAALDLLTAHVGDLPDVVQAVASFRSSINGPIAALREATAIVLDTIRNALEASSKPVEAGVVDLASILGAAE
jgi:sulfite reductase (NADPH) hemoprotein beta-component